MSILVLLVALVAVVAYDVYLLRARKRTISDEIISGALHRPIVAWFVGLVMGALGAHWFWIPTKCAELLR